MTNILVILFFVGLFFFLFGGEFNKVVDAIKCFIRRRK